MYVHSYEMNGLGIYVDKYITVWMPVSTVPVLEYGTGYHGYQTQKITKYDTVLL